MTAIRLFVDEDAMDQRFVQALRSRGVDVETVGDVRTIGFSDEEQLAFASRQNRVLYTFNVGDFCKLHRFYLENKQSHAGIIISSQDYSVGEQMRRILRLMEAKTAENVISDLIFLSSYQGLV
jgi:predicted nuclease of predicted toxin-antitoxin system